MDNQEIISSMIDKIYSGEHVDAKTDFESLISQKMTDAIEAKKQEIAQSLYSNNQPSREEAIDDTTLETETETTDDTAAA